MCGIVGYYGNFGEERLRQASLAISHRGPDADGVWCSQDRMVGLAHRRLAIIDLSDTGAQPMFSDDGGIVLVFNGEIYNYRELRAQLEQKGHRFRGPSDTEVLLRLYLDRGEACLSELNGIFAFALWDQRSNRLLVARDALGVKPLYFAQLGGGFSFSSELKGLLRLVPQARDLDLAALHRYLTYLWCAGAGTPLRGVSKLEPGFALSVHEGRIERKWQWYTLPTVRSVAQDLDERSSIDGLASGLRTAVQRQLVADVPVGAFLSGGLDSSSVVAFAREQVPSIRCFTIEAASGQDDGDVDDLPYARKVAQHLGVPLDVVQIDAARMAHDLESMIGQLDEPLADPAPLNVRYISELARRQGIKVLLSGSGGDDLLTGYRRHVALTYDPYLHLLPRALLSRLDAASGALDQRIPAMRRVAKFLHGAGTEGDIRIAGFFGWSRNDALLALYAPALRAAALADPADRPMRDFLQPMTSTDPIERMLALEQRFFLADHNLVYTDKMSMAAGVEVRVPFLDLDLVEFAARIPTRFKQRGGTGKWVLKKAMEPYLPHDVIYRAKSGFGAPLRRWMRHDLRELVGDLLSPSSIRARGLFDAGAVQSLIVANGQGRVDGAYCLLSLLSIEIWCRKYLDNP